MVMKEVPGAGLISIRAVINGLSIDRFAHHRYKALRASPHRDKGAPSTRLKPNGRGQTLQNIIGGQTASGTGDA